MEADEPFRPEFLGVPEVEDALLDAVQAEVVPTGQVGCGCSIQAYHALVTGFHAGFANYNTVEVLMLRSFFPKKEPLEICKLL